MEAAEVSRRPTKKKPGEIRTDPVRPLDLSTEDWHEVEHGIGLFNAGKFWHAHEAWELVWQRQSEDERLFFQGIIQLAAAYHHLVKGHRTGYVNNLRKADAILRVFAPEYLGIAVSPLLAAIAAGISASEERGGRPPDDREFGLIPKMKFRLPYDPDISVAVRTAIAGGDFGEGVALFNGGYHWEAHERWEETMRNAAGEAKGFLEGFVQAAAGINFLKSGKSGMADFLFRKSVDNLRKFGGLECGVEFQALVEWMERSVNHTGPAVGPGRTSGAGAPPGIGLNGNGAGAPTS